MEDMKYTLLLAATLFAAAPAPAADLAEIKAVYFLPMSRGLDQYLAQKLTAQGVLQVVTDPQKADAIFTDRIGANFEQSLVELYEPPKPKTDEKAEDIYQRPAMQPLSRGKGNIFLVDRKSRDVIWSTFVTPATSDAQEMTKVAAKVVAEFAKSKARPSK